MIAKQHSVPSGRSGAQSIPCLPIQAQVALPQILGPRFESGLSRLGAASTSPLIAPIAIRSSSLLSATPGKPAIPRPDLPPLGRLTAALAAGYRPKYDLLASAPIAAMPVGPLNLITDVPGLRVGNAEDQAVWSGVTVLVPDNPCPAAVDVRGGGPGTRETDLLDPAALVDRIDAIVLSGGSAFGLDAASGVVSWLAVNGHGLDVGGMRVPIVPSAILFDLVNGGDKNWGEDPPYRRLGRQAVIAAKTGAFPLGNVGAGYGAKAGRLKGGLGSASWVMERGSLAGVSVGALVAANPRGSVVMSPSNHFWAWALERDGELGNRPPPGAALASLEEEEDWALPLARANTTIGIVATDATLTKADCRRLAIMAQDGYARAIRPVHTPFDGDTLFVLATGRHPPIGPEDLARLGHVAADCVARATARGVYEAESLGRYPSYRSLLQP